MGAELFIGTLWMGNEGVLKKFSSPRKKFGMGYVKMHGFHGNLLYDSRDWGVGLQIQSYLGFYLS